VHNYCQVRGSEKPLLEAHNHKIGLTKEFFLNDDANGHFWIIFAKRERAGTRIVSGVREEP
jgi:hypothetical protein